MATSTGRGSRRPRRLPPGRRRAVAEADHYKHGEPGPSRELATLKRRLGLRGLDPVEEARVRRAMGAADGLLGVGPRW